LQGPGGQFGFARFTIVAAGTASERRCSAAENRMLPLFHYPTANARDWPGVIALFASLPKYPYAVAMHRPVLGLRDAGNVTAGLHGTTSMLDLDLALGPAGEVINNPHLDIKPVEGCVRLTYDDGSEHPWSVLVSYDELSDRVERFLVKRARWFSDARSHA